MGWWWKRGGPSQEPQSAPSADPRDTLLASFLELERLRVERGAQLDEKKHEIELRKAELELSELERIGTEKRKQQLFQEELTEKKRENLRKARAALKEKQIAERAGKSVGEFCEECQAIQEGRAPGHSSDLMRHSLEGHSRRFINGATH